MKKNKNKLEHRFGKHDSNNPAYYHHLDFRQLDDLDDEGFAYLMDGVKGVNMLDLNETEITDESIKLLTTLEYVTELRAKGIEGLTDACATDLNQIKGLEFLHVKNTSISIDGLLQLKDHPELRTILFSAEDVAAIKGKLLQLKSMHPSSELIIDGKSYAINAIDFFMHEIAQHPYRYRLKIKNETLNANWSTWLALNNDIFIEAETQGSHAIDNIEWIEIDPTEKSGVEQNHTEAIVKLLEYLSFPYMINNGIISAYLVNSEIG